MKMAGVVAIPEEFRVGRFGPTWVEFRPIDDAVTQPQGDGKRARWRWQEAILAHAVKAWDAFDLDGSPIAVSADTIAKLVRVHPDLAAWMVHSALPSRATTRSPGRRRRNSLTPREKKLASRAQSLRDQGEPWNEVSALCEHRDRKTLQAWIELLPSGE